MDGIGCASVSLSESTQCWEKFEELSCEQRKLRNEEPRGLGSRYTVIEIRWMTQARVAKDKICVCVFLLLCFRAS